MTTVVESFEEVMLARLRAAPLTDYGASPPKADRIRRSHLTVVDRDSAPAVYVRFGRARRVSDRSCRWRWEMQWRVGIYVRSDDASEADQPVVAVLGRLNPEAAPFAGDFDVTLEGVDFEAEREIADADAAMVEIVGMVRFETAPWSLQAP